MTEPSEWAPGWAEKVSAAQKLRCYHYFKIPFPRIPYGKDYDFHVKPRCRDCGVLEGQLHVPSCCVERCPICTSLLNACGCPDEMNPGWEDDDGRDPEPDDGGPGDGGGREVVHV